MVYNIFKMRKEEVPMEYNAMTYAGIDVDAVLHNLNEIRTRIGNAMLMAVIKANAYGHGAVELASFIEDSVDWFAVAVIDEAIELRQSGVKKPILILGYTDPSAFDDAVVNDVALTVFTKESAQKLSAAALRLGKKAVVHLAVDTGMSRIGLMPDQVEDAVEIAAMPGLYVQGLFTHFACADESDKSFVTVQSSRFKEFADSLSACGVDVPIKHVANSAAIIEFDDSYLNMVRSGIITYGLYPSDHVDRDAVKFLPAMSLISHVAHVKTVDEGVGVSYGHHFVTKRKTVIATVPVGYADGYPFYMSSKGQVLINGRRADILGRVCMDQMMVDVTDIEGVSVGDRVTLIGCDGDQCILADDLCRESYALNYQLICSVSRRVPRIYFKDGKAVLIKNYLK